MHEPVVVVVADNKPSPTVEQLVRAHGARYLPLPANPGYGGGVNAVSASLPASVEWMLVSNPDIRWHPSAIDSLLATARTDSRIGSVGPMVLNDDGSVYPSARAVPSLRTGIGHALFANVWLGNPWTRAYRAEHTDPDVARDAGWLSGSCVLVRRSAFDELGGFDEGYFMYFEDVDLGYRLEQGRIPQPVRAGRRGQPLGRPLHVGRVRADGRAPTTRAPAGSCSASIPVPCSGRSAWCSAWVSASVRRCSAAASARRDPRFGRIPGNERECPP